MIKEIKTREDYIAALKAHDWFYAYSDDRNTYRRGQAERYAIDAAAKVLDPELTLYKQLSPQGAA